MSVVVVVTAFPLSGHRAEVVAAFEEAIIRVHSEPGVELYAQRHVTQFPYRDTYGPQP